MDVCLKKTAGETEIEMLLQEQQEMDWGRRKLWKVISSLQHIVYSPYDFWPFRGVITTS